MTRNRKVVIDTNVFVSFLLLHGSVPWRAVRHAVEFDEVVVTEATFSELVDVLSRTKLDRYVSRTVREEFITELRAMVLEVQVSERIRACRDPNDDKFLEAAVSGHAHYLITGDRDLLAMQRFRDVAVVSPTRYLRESSF